MIPKSIFRKQKEYLERVEDEKPTSPYKQVKDNYVFINLHDLTEEFEKDPETGFWTCRLHHGVHTATSRDKMIAANIAATYLLDNAIESDLHERFYLPLNKDEAQRYVEWKRSVFQKMDKDIENVDPFKMINEYRQYYKDDIQVETSEQGPPWKVTIHFKEKKYCGDADSKKEARKNTATVIYELLKESNKWYEYKMEQAAALAKKWAETEKYRLRETRKNVDEAPMDEDSNKKKALPKIDHKNIYREKPWSRKDAKILSQQKAAERKEKKDAKILAQQTKFRLFQFKKRNSADDESEPEDRKIAKVSIPIFNVIRFEYLSDKNAAKAQRKLEKKKHRADKKRGGSSDNKEAADEGAFVGSDEKDDM